MLTSTGARLVVVTLPFIQGRYAVIPCMLLQKSLYSLNRPSSISMKDRLLTVQGNVVELTDFRQPRNALGTFTFFPYKIFHPNL